MKWWPIYGLSKQWTEKKKFPSPAGVPLLFHALFRRSLFVFIIDVGSSNALNFEISALESPQYNIHRFGIYLTDSPRRADVLLVLGRPTLSMIGPLKETISQLPQPFAIITIDDSIEEMGPNDYPDILRPVAEMKGIPSPSEILGLLLALSKPQNKKYLL